MVELINISKNEIDACLALSVHAWQEKYTRPIAENLARAYVEPETLIPLAITSFDKPIGFLLFRFEKEINTILLENFMIDSHFQEKGYGTEALRKFVILAENMQGYDRINGLIAIGNLNARKAFERAGFMRGAVDLESRLNEMIFILR